jgi:Probable zinc-ribbon domain
VIGRCRCVSPGFWQSQRDKTEHREAGETTVENIYSDDVLRECVDCLRPFVLYAGEIRFFQTNEPPSPLPKRCGQCRAARKAARRTREEFGHSAGR